MKPISSYLFLAAGSAVLSSCAGSMGPTEAAKPHTVSTDADLAVSCLVWGEMQPPLTELSDERIDGVVTVLSHVLASYGRSNFDAFLALRASDLDHAERSQSERIHDLHALTRQLGVSSDELPSTWIETLRAFWEAYYETPPVQRWIPDETVLHLSEQASDEMRQRSFEALRATLATLDGSRIEHRLVVPARKLEEEAPPSLDLILGFETAQGNRGRLLAQFVQRRNAGRSWSLVRAVTAMETRSPQSTRQLIL